MRRPRPSRLATALIPLGLALLWGGAVDAANGSVTYTYDSLGRIVTASYDTGVCLTYSYDPNGNRLSEAVVAGITSSGTGVWGCFSWNSAKWGP
jgi:hypothetical protein